MSALIEQLAAGQVETLYGLHSAAADVRREVEALRAASALPATAVTDATAAITAAQTLLTASHATLDEGRAALEAVAGRLLNEITDQVTKRVVAQVQTQVDGLVAAQVTAAGSRMARATEEFEARAREATMLVHDAGDAFEERAAAAITRIAEAAEAFGSSAQSWQQSLEQSSTSASEAFERQAAAATTGIAEATGALTASAQAWQQTVEHAMDLVMDRLSTGFDRITQASEHTVGGIERAGSILIDAFAGRVEAFFADLTRDLSRREARDASRERALTTRAQQLAEHSEAMVAAVASRLAQETDRLVRRDVEQETARAEAFVAVLETLLTKVGGRRQLRARVREAVQAERPVPSWSEPVGPEPEPERPPGGRPAQQRAPRTATPRKAAVDKTVTAPATRTAAAPKKAPGAGSKAAATPRKTTTRKKDEA